MSTLCTEAEARVALGLISTITDEERAVINLLLPAAEAAIAGEIGYDPVQIELTEYYPRQTPAGGYLRGGVAWDVDSQHRRALMYRTGGGVPRYPTLQLARLPLRKITRVRVDYEGRHGETSESFGADSEWVQGEDFWGEYDRPNYSPTGCVFGNRVWPEQPGSIEIVYRAGYSPSELQGRATADEVASDGTITTAGINASALKRACLLTLSASVHKWSSLRKTASGFVPAMSSERLGDYSYTLGRGGELASGLIVEIPAPAVQLCEPFKHWGLMRL